MNARARVRVVLVRPENASNVGAVARVLRNTGLDELCLVAPGDWRTLECWRSAWGAQDVLEQAQVHAQLDSALAGASYVAALSGRPEPHVPVLDVRELGVQLSSLPPSAEACLVFGPETSGLSGQELALCGRSVRIPTHPDQPSLNLSHAVLVACYEAYRAREGGAPPGPSWASFEDKQAFLELWEAGLREVAALPKGSQRALPAWRRLFRRLDLTPAELSLFRHLARRMARQGSAPPA